MRILELDSKYLPNASMIIFLSAEYEDWAKMVNSRSQQGDDILLSQAFASQDSMRQAAEAHARLERIPLLHVQQTYGRLDETVLKCAEFIRENMK
ncbi:hypothetical protein TW79_07080 [Tritonibacter mobilis]|uniref:Uncharacterized protein n=2 Tax=Tritonibacter mobilis TaxID=379347 RepID=A0A1B1A101_9RHOB|nr:hypothetical protein K529_005525 [Tritonibacter mobilis F1926]KJZ25407.1 hypothetical protein TW79_07080 [Tritonibacter mobilis]